MDDWILLLGPGLFSGDLLVSGRVPGMRFGGFLGSFWLGDGMRVVPQHASVTCRDDLHSLRFPKYISNMIFHPFLGFSQHQMGIFATHPKNTSQNGFISSNFSKWKDQSSLKLAPSCMDFSDFFFRSGSWIKTLFRTFLSQVGPWNKMYVLSHVPSKQVVLYGPRGCPWQGGGECIQVIMGESFPKGTMPQPLKVDLLSISLGKYTSPMQWNPELWSKYSWNMLKPSIYL